MARGGKPKNPAPVSGPGALARRTDGGPGSKTQPLRVATGGNYGEAKASEDQQKAAPLAGGGPTPAPSLRAGGSATPPIPGGGGVFGPTTRPGENPLTGIAQPGVGQVPNADAVMRMIYGLFPHPQLLKLIRRG